MTGIKPHRIFLRFAGAVLTALVLFSCSHELKQEGIILAHAGDRYLHEEDIKGIVPKGTPAHDSIRIVRDYIKKWIETQLIVNKAENNLPEEKLNFEKQLEDYKNSLIIFRYETELIRQKLDTVVSENEIKEYYLSHQSDFHLKNNILKAVYAVLPNSDEGADEARYLKKLFRLPDSLIVDTLESYASGQTIIYSTDTSSWFRFNDFLKKIPLETKNQEKYLKTHRFDMLKDDRNIYLIKIIDYRLAGQTAPRELEAPFIKSILLNKRKKQLVKNLHNDIYRQGIKENLFEIY